ncbi:MAG: GIY-YIG nuclease family protein [Calditrichaceae bacterium]|jgi:Uri superfamily endonuclease
MSSEKISYQIIFTLNTEIKLQVGKIGKYIFPEGRYIYTGSARKNIDSRIQRHQKKDKKLHWHIDYLLIQNECEIQDIIKSDLDECKLNQSADGEIIVAGFGASDCREGCISHLKYQG